MSGPDEDQPGGGMLRVVVERDRCRGYANCLDVAPDVFDLDDHDIAVTGADRYPAARRHQLERAVDRCPARALRLEDVGEAISPEISGEITGGPPA